MRHLCRYCEATARAGDANNQFTMRVGRMFVALQSMLRSSVPNHLLPSFPRRRDVSLAVLSSAFKCIYSDWTNSCFHSLRVTFFIPLCFLLLWFNVNIYMKLYLFCTYWLNNRLRIFDCKRKCSFYEFEYSSSHKWNFGITIRRFVFHLPNEIIKCSHIQNNYLIYQKYLKDTYFCIIFYLFS